MAFFDDMTTALETYPVDNVTIEIVDVVFAGSAINVGEEGTFKVRVNNNGPLEMTDVILKISSQNGARVRNNGGAAPPFASEFITSLTQIPTITGHDGSVTSTGGGFKFKAPAGAQGAKVLIKATIEGWNANLNHILNSHSKELPDQPKGTFNSAVIIS